MKWIALFLFTISPLQAQIYADFETTSGDFTVELHYDKTPKTVANFIGLAEGSRPWIDAEGELRNSPFYTGITFHRVIDGFMNQFGSPNGLGTDGPGYSFADEFDATLNHNSGYVLSMANSGPHTNGSQLFITVSPQTQLNNVHTVFGYVLDDGHSRQTIDAINTAPKDPTDSQKLLTPVSITSVAIRRVGTDATNFDIHSQNLPDITAPAPSLSPAIALTLPKNTASVIPVYHSTELSSWQNNNSFYFDEDDALGNTIDLTSIAGSNTSCFFRTPLVTYHPVSPYLPSTFTGRTLSIDGSQLNGVTQFTFTSETGGSTLHTNPDSSTINSTFGISITQLTPNKFNAFITTGLYVSGQEIRYRITLGMDSSTPTTLDGRESGSLYLYNPLTLSYSSPYPESGTFSLTR